MPLSCPEQPGPPSSEGAALDAQVMQLESSFPIRPETLPTSQESPYWYMPILPLHPTATKPRTSRGNTRSIMSGPFPSAEGPEQLSSQGRERGYFGLLGRFVQRRLDESSRGAWTTRQGDDYSLANPSSTGVSDRVT